MSTFSEYSTRYTTIKMERDAEGILLVTFHTDGKPLRWGPVPHTEFPAAFHDIGTDKANRVIILTGTGDEFSGPVPPAATRMRRPALEWDRIVWEGRNLLTNLLNIEVPMIGVINGPALRHSEIPLLCDIVLADEKASLQDAGHFDSGFVPGDGVNIIYPMLMGANRGRYFLLTGQSIGAREAKELGLVNEVLPTARLLERAWEHARTLAKHPDLHLRYTRMALTETIKKQLRDHLGYSLVLEALANMERAEPPKAG